MMFAGRDESFESSHDGQLGSLANRGDRTSMYSAKARVLGQERARVWDCSAYAAPEGAARNSIVLRVGLRKKRFPVERRKVAHARF